MGYLTVCTTPLAAVRDGLRRPHVAAALLEMSAGDSHQDGPGHARRIDLPDGTPVERLATCHSTQGALFEIGCDGGHLTVMGASARPAPGSVYVRTGHQVNLPTIEMALAADSGEMVRCADGFDAAALADTVRRGHDPAAVLADVPAVWPSDADAGLLVLGVFEDHVRHGGASAADLARALDGATDSPWPRQAGQMVAPVGVVTSGRVVVYAGENRLVRWRRLVELGTDQVAAAVELLLQP